MFRPLLIAAALLAPFTVPNGALATVVETSAGRLQITEMISGLEEPWALAFLPDGGVLVSERDRARLNLWRDGRLVALTGVPAVRHGGQGGLLDVMVPRDFATSREVWLTYSLSFRGDGATAMGRGRLNAEGTALEGFQLLWSGTPAGGGRHFGARLAEAPDGTIWLGTGDRGTGPGGQQAQDPGSSIGKVMAFDRAGKPLPARPGWAPGVASLGHRNIQGAAFDANGQFWVIEHGARGGDELNRIEPGLNYGWPVIAYGVNYIGTRIGTGTHAPGMEQPVHYWDPSIAPSGLAIHPGDGLLPEWGGSLLLGSLKFDHIVRLDPARGFAEERIAAPETGRVRDVRIGPDGAVWFLSVTRGAAYRIAPVQ